MVGKVITLTTDFGTSGPYVAEMKGVILSLHEQVALIDITHAIPPQDIRSAAFVLEQAAWRFPVGTIHVAVVDPGVGTDRSIVCAEIGGHCFIAPDNGLLSRLAIRHPISRIVALTNPAYWLEEVSLTFHGRDKMAPVAAHLSLGVKLNDFGEPVDRLTTLDWPQPMLNEGRVDGIVQYVDGFGNLISNIPRAALGSCHPLTTARITSGNVEISGIRHAYAQAANGEPIALVGSHGYLEIAVTGGNAADRLSLGCDATITVQQGKSSVAGPG